MPVDSRSKTYRRQVKAYRAAGKDSAADQMEQLDFLRPVDMRRLKANPDLGVPLGSELERLIGGLILSLHEPGRLGLLGSLWGSDLGGRVLDILMGMTSCEGRPYLQRYAASAIERLTMAGVRLQSARMYLLSHALEAWIGKRRIDERDGVRRERRESDGGVLDQVLAMMRKEVTGAEVESLEREVSGFISRDDTGDTSGGLSG